MRLLVIDNYDSFTYNLVQYLGELGASMDVVRNDALEAAVRACAGAGIPLLGVCLGHQAIGLAFGGRIVRARSIMHGKVSRIEHDGLGVFRGVENPFEATRYHSLVVAEAELPSELEVTARTRDGEVMGLRHRDPAVLVEGVQFHPESILTRVGKSLLRNFLGGCAPRQAA